MYPCRSTNDFDVTNADEIKDIASDSSVSKVSCINQCENKDQESYNYVGFFPESGSLHDFLKLPTNDNLCQDDSCIERLLVPDVFSDTFENTKLSKSELVSATDSCNAHQSSAKKLPLAEYEASSTELIPKTEDIQDTDNGKYSDSSSVMFTERKHNVYEMSGIHVVRKELKLKSYHRNNLSYKETNANIYRDAIKKIIVDSNKSFINFVLEKTENNFKRKTIVKSSVDISKTYSNLRKYILEKLSPFIDEIMPTADILISAEMSVSDLRSACISNDVFFEKLRENCEKIVTNIICTYNDNLEHIFQSSIRFEATNDLSGMHKDVLFIPNKSIFIPKLKELIIDTISNLPNSIISEIEKFSQNDIVDSIFLNVHGIFISKSLVRNINYFFKSNKNKPISNDFDDNLNLFNVSLGKLERLVKESCIFHEKVISPNESIVKLLSKYLLSDMYGISSKFHHRLKACDENVEESDDFPENEFENEAKQTESTLAAKNSIQLERFITLKELRPRVYHRNRFIFREFTANIYEDAIKKIDVDDKGSFKNILLNELDSYITKRWFVKSSMDISLTYSNVRKYVLDKVSPYINDILKNMDVLITVGMSISDMRFNCTSNEVFFEKLREGCEKIEKDTRMITDDVLLKIIQSNISFGSDGRINISHFVRINKILSELRTLIAETVSNLPNSIIHVIKNFKQTEVVKGLFLDVHGIFVSRHLIRTLKSFFDFNKVEESFKYDVDFFNNLLIRLVEKVDEYPVLHQGKLFFPDKYTTEIISRYLLSDVYAITAKLRKKIKISDKTENSEGEEEFKESINIVNVNPSYKNNVAPMVLPQTMGAQSIEKETDLSNEKLKWDPTLITSLNIYELAISMIKIDIGNFNHSFIDKIKHSPLVKKYLEKKGKVNIDLSVTFDRIKSYILEKFYHFLKGIGEGTRLKIKLYQGMSIRELEDNYVSNEEFFSKLREFCASLTESIEGITDTTLIDLMRCFILSESRRPKRLVINKSMAIKFHEDIARILIKNISNLPEMIVSAIKLLPKSTLAREHLSPFYEMYIDNIWLLKVKSIFDCAHDKIIDDPLLSWLVDKVSTDMIDKFSTGDRTKVSKQQYKLINGHIACIKLSAYKYIKKIARDLMTARKDDISAPILIMDNDEIKTADPKTRRRILCMVELSLISVSINIYRKLCLDAYKSKIENKCLDL
ncbi:MULTISPECIES: hypothetical protein [Candidatus Ichthyocystis]|uniref:Uncharacterized protein n=1 Tax=Candidatus Ichthyocystis hellenicum TaxID=1561003 RepID=A0A0S4M7K1_9BURK|nr:MULTISPECIES: hypothetical protein [Ichthyocystis]CUT18262.1 hypothetical protein Ark11_1464 [Candidatus Ichthyocystis hellenicum]